MAPAGALCFDPPISRDVGPLDLGRADREPVAYVGYEELITRHFHIRLDDRTRFYDRNTAYDRRATDVRTGVVYR